MAGKGTLVIQLYTARRAIPIRGASVTISMKKGEDTELTAYRQTNENGATEAVEIETPNVEASLTPSEPIISDEDFMNGGNSNVNGTDNTKVGEAAETPERNTANEPFASVNIQIDHPLYYSVLIENAQIFPGQESIQQIELVPLPEFPNGSRNMIFYIPPQNL